MGSAEWLQICFWTALSEFLAGSQPAVSLITALCFSIAIAIWNHCLPHAPGISVPTFHPQMNARPLWQRCYLCNYGTSGNAGSFAMGCILLEAIFPPAVSFLFLFLKGAGWDWHIRGSPKCPLMEVMWVQGGARTWAVIFWAVPVKDLKAPWDLTVTRSCSPSCWSSPADSGWWKLP